MSAQAQVPATQQGTNIESTPKKFNENTLESVLDRVSQFQKTGDIRFPDNYIPENAVRSAWLVLQGVTDRNGKPALSVCTKESVANAFLKMVTKGLSVAKGQCYFVVYGTELSLDESYFGNILIAKRDGGVKKDPKARIIYEGDVFEYVFDEETECTRVTKHEQKFQNIKMDKIVGAYAVVEYEDGTKDTEIMTMDQIRSAWGQGATKGNSPAHKNFPDQMAKKSVLNRAIKIAINASDDSALYPSPDQVEEDVKARIKDNANSKVVSFDDYSEVSTQLPQAKQVEVVPAAKSQPEGIKVNNVARNSQPAQATIDGPGF